jgi:hypothetical protein
MWTKGKYTKSSQAGQEQHVGLEGDAVREGPGDERRGDDGEHHLVGDENEEREWCRFGEGVLRLTPRRKARLKLPMTPVPVAAEAQGVAIEIPDDGGPPIETKLCIMMARTFLRPTRPP